MEMADFDSVDIRFLSDDDLDDIIGGVGVMSPLTVSGL